MSVGGAGFQGYENPDDLVGLKGLEVYETMCHNAQVSACLSIKRASVLSRGWDICARKEDGSSGEEIALFCSRAFEWMEGSVFEVLDNVCDALAKGYSIQSMVWGVIDRGKCAGKMAPVYVSSKDPGEWNFLVNDYRRMTGLIHTPTDTRYGRADFVVYVNRGKYGNPYGESDLRNAYRHWWSVDFLERFWNLYMEKFGSPTVKGSYKRGTTAAAKSLFLSALTAVQSKSAVIFPDDMKVELLETIRQGEAGFRLACEYHNKQMAKAILNQTLVTDDGSGVGSFALAKVHLDVLRMCLRGLKVGLEESVMTEQVVRRLVEVNYGYDAPVPVFSLGPLEDREIEPLSRSAKNMVDAQIVANDDPWLREFLGIVGAGKAPARLAGPGSGVTGAVPSVSRTRVDGNTNDGTVRVGT
ncbi:MAG: hypothetical protein B7Z62_00215 [Deltaproteobacteria bacterium 37-65-8]|nr:MAG: hypothetical protein B7Z62_00215 [Deltaproteobacteria bacterium 37-65-8]